MLGLTFKGIKHGSSSIGTPSIGGHYRPIDYDIGFTGIKCDVRLDNVESDVGESGDTSHIRSIQLSCSQYQRKEQK